MSYIRSTNAIGLIVLSIRTVTVAITIIIFIRTTVIATIIVRISIFI